MSDPELRDAYLYVEVQHPRGHWLKGKMVPWREALAILALIQEYQQGAGVNVLEQARKEFLAVTGIGEDAIADLSPGATTNLIFRFFGELPRMVPNGGRALSDATATAPPSSAPAATAVPTAATSSS